MKRLFAYVTAVCIAGGMALSAFGAGTYVEYVDSDYNRKNAINTGYIVNPKTRIAMDFAMALISSAVTLRPRSLERTTPSDRNAVCIAI